MDPQDPLPQRDRALDSAGITRRLRTLEAWLSDLDRRFQRHALNPGAHASSSPLDVPQPCQDLLDALRGSRDPWDWASSEELQAQRRAAGEYTPGPRYPR